MKGQTVRASGCADPLVSAAVTELGSKSSRLFSNKTFFTKPTVGHIWPLGHRRPTPETQGERATLAWGHTGLSGILAPMLAHRGSPAVLLARLSGYQSVLL